MSRNSVRLGGFHKALVRGSKQRRLDRNHHLLHSIPALLEVYYYTVIPKSRVCQGVMRRPVFLLRASCIFQAQKTVARLHKVCRGRALQPTLKKTKDQAVAMSSAVRHTGHESRAQVEQSVPITGLTVYLKHTERWLQSSPPWS